MARDGREFHQREFHREDRLVCRHVLYNPGRWTRKEEEPKYPPDRTCDVEHLKLELAIELPRRSVRASCSQRLRAAYGPIKSITLDAVGLRIDSVRDAWGRDLPYTYLQDKLTVRFPDPIEETEELVIRYGVEQPVEGLFFFGPDEAEPDADWQMWSQGEDEGARHWIPCHDAPHERMTTEVAVTVPARYTVISNGRLLGVEESAGAATPEGSAAAGGPMSGNGPMKTWRFAEKVAHPSYLIMVAVGVFNRIEDRWRDTPVEYFVAPGREEEGRRSFGRTPEMIEFFSDRLDTPYPYEKYAQVAIRHFHFGGMENTSATTQTELTLHDERAALDFSSDELVAHELAHQWFGDLVTCKSWTHAWLNEGFATYFEALWKEFDKGRAEFDYEMLQNAADYLAEGYRRPIATSRYTYPFEMFDMHLYPKAAWVLHMLRRRVGDDLFWKSIRLYLKRHAPGSVETVDLVRAFEDATGKTLNGFFDQWIFSPGHPELEGELSWEDDASRLKFSLKQTQKREDGVPVFHLPFRLEARAEAGETGGLGGSGAGRALSDAGITTAEFLMDQPEQTFYWPLPAKPAWVLFDPDGSILRETKIKMPLEWMEAALLGPSREERILPRVDLVRQLAEDAGPRSVRLLGRVLREDPFWGVQIDAARVLGKLRTPAALDELLSATDVSHPKARRAVVTALGNWKDPKAGEALRDITRRGDPSYHVEMAAHAAFGRSAGLLAAEELRHRLREALARRDWHDTVAMGAVEGLVAARDEHAVDDLLAVARDRSRYWRARLGAIKGLAELGAARPVLAPRIAEGIEPFLDDPEYLVASRMPDALVTLGEQSAVGALRRKGMTTPLMEVREVCLKAADELASSAHKGEEVDRLRAEQDKLRDELKQLRETLEGIKAKVEPEKPEKSGEGAASTVAPAASSSESSKPATKRPALSGRAGSAEREDKRPASRKGSNT